MLKCLKNSLVVILILQISSSIGGIFKDNDEPKGDYAENVAILKANRDWDTQTTGDGFDLRYKYFFGKKEEIKAIFLYIAGLGALPPSQGTLEYLNEIASKNKAIVVAPEHRYFGQSMPFTDEKQKGKDFENYENIKFLSVNFVLKDLNKVLEDVSSNKIGSQQTKIPIIAFGGGYGGLLATWLHSMPKTVVTHAVVSSANLRGFVGVENATKPGEYDEHLIYIFETWGNCTQGKIRKAFDAIEALAVTKRYKTLNEAFRLEPSIGESRDADAKELRLYLKNLLGNLAHSNGPYKRKMELEMEFEMEPYPVKKFCESLNLIDMDASDTQMVKHFATALSTFGNPDKRCVFQIPDCFKQDTDHRLQAEHFLRCTGLADMRCGPDDKNKTFYQECKNEDDMLENLKKSCIAMFPFGREFEQKIVADLVKKNFSKDPATIKNITFVNPYLSPSVPGTIDPGKQDFDDGRFIFNVTEASTHLDLELPNNCDPNTLSDTRSRITAIITYWINGRTKSCSSGDILEKLHEKLEKPLAENVPINDSKLICDPLKNSYPYWPRNPSNGVLSIHGFGKIAWLGLLIIILLITGTKIL